MPPKNSAKDQANKPRRSRRPRRAPKLKVSEKPKIQTEPKQNQPNALRFIPLGGLDEIGRNMMILEWRDYEKDDRDIIIVDMGLQFPEQGTPGIDYIIPNISYLKDKIKDIHGVLITHGHLDHIGAIPHLMEKIGNPVMYATPLTAAIVKKRQLDFPNSPKLKFQHIDDKSEFRLGPFTIRTFPVTHNIPEGVGYEIETPVGTVVHPGEFKFHYDRDLNPVGIEPFKELGKKDILLLMMDSTRSEEAGRSVPEWQVEENIEKLLAEAEGRVIISTFASLLDRLAQIIHIADKLGRKVAITGRSMEANFAIAQELGIIKIKKGTIIPIKKIGDYNDKKILILTTGAQGEEYAGLTRMAKGAHKDVKIHPGDAVILSSSIIPGNEHPIQALWDDLSRRGAIVHHYGQLDIHSGGHATRQEIKETIEMIKPKYFLPIHGYYFMRKMNIKNAEEAGVKPENTILIDNGQVVRFTKNGFSVDKKPVQTSYVMVDGLGVGDIGSVVLRDRQVLAEDGMFVVITVIDSKTGRVVGNPDIISRGFVYLRESKELLRETRRQVKQIVQKTTAGSGPFNEAFLKDEIRKQVGKFLFKKTERKPMILPVLIEV